MASALVLVRGENVRAGLIPDSYAGRYKYVVVRLNHSTCGSD